MGKALLVALEGSGVRKCEMTDLFVYFEVFYCSSAGETIKTTRAVLFCLEVEVLCDIEVWVA